MIEVTKAEAQLPAATAMTPITPEAINENTTILVRTAATLLYGLFDMRDPRTKVKSDLLVPRGKSSVNESGRNHCNPNYLIFKHYYSALFPAIRN